MIKFETDSRKIKAGQTFVAIKGNTVDGHDYISNAINNGASFIVSQKELSKDIPHLVVDDTNKYLTKALSDEYSKEFKDINFIGITGTNGKTTSAYIAYQMLLNLNVNAAYIGTLGFYTKDYNEELENTTPDIVVLYNLLLKAKELNVTHVIMEVSSHALALDRIAGIKLDAAAFTNLTQDHLDFHGTMENYLNDKLRIVDYLKENAKLIVNNDDDYANNFTNKYVNNITFGLNGDVKILDYNITPAETTLNFVYNNNYTVKYNLTSLFNIYNYLTALLLINSIGFNINKILEISPNISAPKGRCETIKVNNAFAVIDFAHTPDAVSKVINAYKEFKQNKIITVIGTGGDRDPKKRPIMGKIATDNSDYVVFTSDNPRSEDPDLILNDIIKDLNNSNYEVIVDRKEAIDKALSILEDNDILLILGKGHENYQIIGTTKHHFDDLEVVKSFINSH